MNKNSLFIFQLDCLNFGRKVEITLIITKPRRYFCQICTPISIKLFAIKVLYKTHFKMLLTPRVMEKFTEGVEARFRS